MASDGTVSTLDFIGVRELVKVKDFKGIGKAHTHEIVPSGNAFYLFRKVQLFDGRSVTQLILDFVS